MKFLTLLLVCWLAKDISGGKVPIGPLLAKIQKQMDTVVAVKQKEVAATGSTAKVPHAPKVPKPADPNQLVNTIRVPLPNPKCDLKGLTELLKAWNGKTKGSCSGVKKSKGSLAGQCNAAKANFTAEFRVMFEVTKQVSYEFPNCSGVVDPAVKGCQSSSEKVFDSLALAPTTGDKKKSKKSIELAVRDWAGKLKELFDAMNYVTGSAKPAAGTNAADCVSASELSLSTTLQVSVNLLDMVASVSADLSLDTCEIAKALKALVTALSTKTADGKVKILGSECVKFSASLSVTMKSVSSIDLDEFTKQCSTIQTDFGKLTNSTSEIESEDDKETATQPPAQNATQTPGQNATQTPAQNATQTPAQNATQTPAQNATQTPGGSTAKPSAVDLAIKISANIKVSIESITKSCAPLKTDVPGMDGKFDAALSNVGIKLCALMSTIQTYKTSPTDKLSTQIDDDTASFAKVLCEFLTLLDGLIESSSKDTSEAGKAACAALKIVRKTIVSISVNAVASASVIVEKSDCLVTVRLDASVTVLKKIDLENIDSKKLVTDLTVKTSPTERNPESCKKVVEHLGECTTKAMDKCNTKNSEKFESRISFLLDAYRYTMQKYKAPKVCDGITSLKTSFSPLIKDLFAAVSSAEASKAEDGSKQAANSTEKDDKSKGISPDRFKALLAAIRTVVDESKSAKADPSLGPADKELQGLIVKDLLTSIDVVITGMSTAASNQSIVVSVGFTLIIEVITNATSEDPIDYVKLSAAVDGLQCYSGAVDTSKSSMDAVKEIETNISKPEATKEETDADFSKLSKCGSDALITLRDTVPSFTKYYNTSVDPVRKGIDKINLVNTDFINGRISLEDFLLNICSALGELIKAYNQCEANTALDPKGYNARKGLKFVCKSVCTVIKTVFISFKIKGNIPTELTDFYTSLSDALKTDSDSPDAEPNELGDKVKGACDKYKQSKAATTGTTASPAVTTASPAGTTATTAGTTASPAETTASTAGTTASPAVTTASTAVTTASTSGTTASTAETTASTAASTVSPAVTTASTNGTTASPAETTASTAGTTVSPAVTTASTAVTTASTA